MSVCLFIQHIGLQQDINYQLLDTYIHTLKINSTAMYNSKCIHDNVIMIMSLFYLSTFMFQRLNDLVACHNKLNIFNPKTDPARRIEKL